jgi:hypothetical protein
MCDMYWGQEEYTENFDGEAWIEEETKKFKIMLKVKNEINLKGIGWDSSGLAQEQFKGWCKLVKELSGYIKMSEISWNL